METNTKNSLNNIVTAIIVVAIVAAAAFYFFQSPAAKNTSSKAGNGNAGVATVGSMPINTTGIQGSPKDRQDSP